MQTKHTFSTIYWLQTTRTVNNEALIYIRITVDGKRVNFSLKKRVPINIWDSKKKKVKGTTAHAKQTNLYLEEVKSQLFQIYQDLKFKGQFITAQLIKSHYTNTDIDEGKTIIEIIEYHNQKISNTLAPGSIRNFGVTESYVKKFLKKKKHTSDIYLKQLNFQFLSDFQMYLSNLYPVGHPKALGNNTVMKHIQRLRKMITLAFHMEWIDKDPFVRFRMSFEKTNREFLSENELYNLEKKEFISDRLDRVRDLFIFSCYTGISYVDVMALTPDNMVMGIDGNNWIITKRQKTDTVVKVPLLPQALEIIQKYKDHPVTVVSESLLPKLSNEKLNMYLKEVANFVGIKKNLTFHMARHTFATTITLSNGVPIETVSKILGHTKITTTQIYARVLENKVSSDMNQLKSILETKSHNEKQKEPSKSSNSLNINYKYV